MSQDLTFLKEHFPFLTVFNYANTEYVGVVQNSSKSVTSVYIFNRIVLDEQKKKFLDLANIWWNESNRKIPINLFFKSDFDEFSCFVLTFITKEMEIVSGHTVSIQNLNSKRIKRKRTELHILK